MERKGIAVAGSALVDKINEIKVFPKVGELTQICNISRAVGGLVPNDGIDLKRIDPNLDVYALGKIGNDGEGEFLINELKKNGVDTTQMVCSDKLQTSFTDVMSIAGGERTFFTYAGASADFGLRDIDFEKANYKMLHLGYFLLLDKVDNGDGIKILREAKKYGIKTSIDLVSENSDRYELIIPCLPYVDNLIVNELEAGKIAGIPSEDGNIEKIAKKLKQMGVKERIIIHKPDFAVCLSDSGYTVVPSLNLPKGYIKGATGAGDAFCAGSLYGIYNGYDDKELLEFASMCAVVSLREKDAVSGMVDAKSIKDFCKQFERKQLKF